MTEIWLAASLEAHAFIPGAFWENNADEMRSVYLPRAENYRETAVLPPAARKLPVLPLFFVFIFLRAPALLAGPAAAAGTA